MSFTSTKGFVKIPKEKNATTPPDMHTPLPPSSVWSTSPWPPRISGWSFQRHLQQLPEYISFHSLAKLQFCYVGKLRMGCKWAPSRFYIVTTLIWIWKKGAWSFLRTLKCSVNFKWIGRLFQLLKVQKHINLLIYPDYDILPLSTPLPGYLLPTLSLPSFRDNEQAKVSVFCGSKGVRYNVQMLDNHYLFCNDWKDFSVWKDGNGDLWLLSRRWWRLCRSEDGFAPQAPGTTKLREYVHIKGEAIYKKI